MWTCPKCHTKVDPAFEVCWQCGTTIDGIEDPTFVRADDAAPINEPPVTEEALATVPVVERTTPPNPWGPDVEPVECYRAEDRMQAHFLAEELTKIGIPAVADSHEPNESLGGMGSLPKVWVRTEDFARARLWLEGYELIHREQHPARDE
jgi:hypothetical protein